MFRHIKYEYRKDLALYIVLFAILFALEAFLGFSILVKNEILLVTSIVLFILGAFAGIVFIMVMGVVSYAREINAKYSYMTFMTPTSSYSIVGAKYLSLFLATVLASGLYVLFIWFDVQLILFRFHEINDFLEGMSFLLEFFGFENILVSVLATLFNEWLTIFATISYAYLAITLSATILANKKGKGGLAVGFFAAIYILTRVILYYLPTFDLGETFGLMVAGRWPTFLFEILAIAGTYFGVSVLLEKKVSL